MTSKPLPIYFVLIISVFLIQKGFSTDYTWCSADIMAPFFEPRAVVGRPWRGYMVFTKTNSWEQYACAELTFKIATPEENLRLYHEMKYSVDPTLLWDSDTLLMTVGSDSEFVLVPDPGPTGGYFAIPRNLDLPRLPTVYLFLKLTHDFRFMIMIDCYGSGDILFMYRPDSEPPTGDEIKHAVKKHRLTHVHFCTTIY